MSEADREARAGGPPLTTPGGVPNLPQGALTLENLASSTQDMSGTAMKSRAVQRFPGIMDNSTGLSPLSDLTPFGILTRIWAEFNAAVANADPADIQGPEDLPELLLQFIEGLPVVGQFVGVLEAILGTYDGDDAVLLAVQEFFKNLREFLGSLNFLDPDFSIVTAASKFWQLILKPTGLAVSTHDVVGARMPVVLPFTLGDAPDSIVHQWFLNLRNFLPFDLADPLLDLAEAAASLVENVLSPTEIFLGIFNRSTSNTAAITALEAKVLGEVGTDAISEDFSGVAGDLDGFGWTGLQYGGTAARIARNGSGRAVVAGHGGGVDQTSIYLLDDPDKKLSSHIQWTTHILARRINATGSCAYRIPLRVGATTDRDLLNNVSLVLTRSGSGNAAFAIQLDGVIYLLDDDPGASDSSATGLTFTTQDRWDVVIGDPLADPVTQTAQYNWRWRAWLNGLNTTPVIDTVFDPSSWNADAADLLDETTYNCPALGMSSDGTFIGVPGLAVPTDVELITWATPDF